MIKWKSDSAQSVQDFLISENFYIILLYREEIAIDYLVSWLAH